MKASVKLCLLFRENSCLHTLYKNINEFTVHFILEIASWYVPHLLRGRVWLFLLQFAQVFYVGVGWEDGRGLGVRTNFLYYWSWFVRSERQIVRPSEGGAL